MIFLFAGCDVTYNLSIGDSFQENVNVINYTLDKNNVFYYETVSSVNNGIYMYDNDDRYNYDAKIISEDDKFGAELNGTFNSDNIHSKAVSMGVDNYMVQRYDGKVSLSGSGFKIFEQNESLDNLTININCKYKVLESNADSINGNIYTWNINRSNYMNKTIALSYREKTNYDPMTIFSIGLVVVCIICLIIYLFVRGKYLKRNSL